jgi:SAM-dependent methyltransferase
MDEQIIDLQDWIQTPPGQYLLDWEGAQVEGAVADIFGYHALQLGMAALQGLQHNRMPHRWFAQQHLGLVRWDSSTPALRNAPGVSLVTDFSALPFPGTSLDLVILPHTLELSTDAHATLREVERVLVPEGRVVICGFNPLGLWAFRQARAQLWSRLSGGRLGGVPYLPQANQYLGYWRLRDWLKLLGFEVEVARFGCYAPAVQSQRWLSRFGWLERLGERWWPIFGSSYFLVGVKRVHGVRLMGAHWRKASARASRAVPAAQREQNQWQREHRE